MAAPLTVTPAPATATGAAGASDTTAAGHDHGAAGEETDWDALDMAMMETMLAFPAETEGKGNVPLEPTILPDGTKQFELTAEIVQWEVEPGKLVEAWTYNGMVPGPQIRVDLGDRVQIVVHNELPMGTDVHWHGISTPFDMDGVAPYTQELIGSGEDFVYEFDAEEPAIGMYHAHHHGQMQVPNGMFGPFIIGDTPIPYGRTISGIEIPETIELAAEIPMVLNDAGTIGFSLNGKSFPATEPLVVAEGDWFVVHYYNEGLAAHPMHLHQFEQLIFAKDGIPLDEPYFADTINIAPGERYSVLVQADRAGTWVWHCHILTHVERAEGMFGMVTAVVVEPGSS
jgi:FtsP/CotA-like multicopper oxidase with cupredoxin domain